MRYSYELKNNRHFNEFDLDRVFLGFNWDIGNSKKIRCTLEGGDIRENGTDQTDWEGFKYQSGALQGDESRAKIQVLIKA